MKVDELRTLAVALEQLEVRWDTEVWEGLGANPEEEAVLTPYLVALSPAVVVALLDQADTAQFGKHLIKEAEETLRGVYRPGRKLETATWIIKEARGFRPDADLGPKPTKQVVDLALRLAKMSNNYESSVDADVEEILLAAGITDIYNPENRKPPGEPA